MHLIEEDQGNFHLSEDQSIGKLGAALSLLYLIPVCLLGTGSALLGLYEPIDEPVFVWAGGFMASVAIMGIWRAIRVFWTPKPWARIRFDA